MTITFSARYKAKTYAEAVGEGTRIWQEFLGDGQAELPWDAHIKVDLDPADEHAVLSVKISKTE